jgi:Fe-S cluster assembly protein SufD
MTSPTVPPEPSTLAASLRAGRPASTPALRDFTLHAVERVATLPWPTKRDEAWKYTDPGLFASSLTSVLTSGAVPSELPAAPSIGPELGRVTWADGAVPRVEGLESIADANVRVWSALADAPDEVQARALAVLGARVLPAASRFEALLAASAAHAVVVHVPRNVAPSLPLHVVHVRTSSDVGAVTLAPVVVLLDEGASLGVVESLVGSDDAAGTVLSGLHADVGANAQLTAARLVLLPTSVQSLDRREVRLARDARFLSFVFGGGAGTARDDLDVRVSAPGAFTGLYGLSAVRGDQLSDHHTMIDHTSADTSSEQIYRAIAQDRGHIVFNGRVFIRQDAQRVNAEQMNRTLMLSPDARVDAKPQLEIFADDVKCGHGATIGQLDPDELFYLQSRGLSPSTAHRLLVRGFAADLVDHIPIDGLRERFQALFDSTFFDGEEG